MDGLGDIGMAPELLAWWLCLCIAASLNAILYLRLLRKPLSGSKPHRAYERTLRLLALPVVVQCAWRSIFPSLYLQRFTFWDTPLNSILLDRSLACAGELSWNFALATVIMHIDRETCPPRGTWWVRLSAATLFGLYVVAELVSYYNTATTNELWAAVEVALDAISQVVAAPAALMLLGRARRRVATGSDNSVGSSSSAHIFLCLFLVMSTVYPLYNLTIDVPLYLRRYRADESHGKHYLPLWRGLLDAATRRVPTHKLSDWRDDMQWMVLYFVFNPLGAILVARSAPSVATPCCGEAR